MNSTADIKRQYKSFIDKIREPSGYCQACFSQTLNEGAIVTCSICESSIHASHYGHELCGPIKFVGEWKCQRCRYLIQKNFKTEVKCKFCPSIKGIIKKIKFNSNEIWIHPQCSTWCYPIIFQFNNNKRIIYSQQFPSTPTSKFWCRIEKEKEAKCQICLMSQGYKIKCSFYSCLKFYHATCAKKIGVIRDLQSMKFQKAMQYCPPYCEAHLQMKVLDCANRIKIYTESGYSDKVALFTQVHNGYRIQLKNLHVIAKKFKQEEQMRTQLGKQILVQYSQESSMSLSVSEKSILSQHPSEFYAFIQNKINSQELQKILQQKQKQQKKNQAKMIMSYKKDIYRDGRNNIYPEVQSFQNCQQENESQNHQNQSGFEQCKFHQSSSQSQQQQMNGKDKVMQKMQQQVQSQMQQQIQQQFKENQIFQQQQSQFIDQQSQLKLSQLKFENKQCQKMRTSSLKYNENSKLLMKKEQDLVQLKDQIYFEQISDQIDKQQVEELSSSQQRQIYLGQKRQLNKKDQNDEGDEQQKVRDTIQIQQQHKLTYKQEKKLNNFKDQIKNQSQNGEQYSSQVIYQESQQSQANQKNQNKQYIQSELQESQSIKKQSNSEYSQLYQLKGQTIYSSCHSKQKLSKQHFDRQNWTQSIQQNKISKNKKISKNLAKLSQKSIKKTKKYASKLEKKKMKKNSQQSQSQQSEDELYELEEDQSFDQ